MFRDLAREFNAQGWDVARYGKYGVYSNHIDYDKYRKTDLKFTVDQIKNVWRKISKDKPVIVFALSEGTLHAHFLPLKEARAIVLLGAISNNIRDVFLDQAETAEDKEREVRRLDSAFNMKRDEMLGKSSPAGRYVDEMRMKDNWTYYTPYKDIPTLILHGEDDKEVGLYQSKTWKEKLPNHNITIATRPKGNHTFGIGDKFDAKFLADTICAWLDKGALTTK